MKDASQYAVKHPFGATYSPWSTSKPHLGEDRPCPTGTPLIVAGQTIGLTGNTGKSSGPHLHIQKVKNGVVVSPEGKGFQVTGVVTQTGYSDEIGNYIRITDAQGTVWSYFHLSEVLVTNGQKIGVQMTKNEAYTVVDGFYRWGTGAAPTPEQSEYWADRLVNVPTGLDELYQAMKKEADNSEYVETKVYIKKEK